jgi:peptidoglycan/xylan/chitin deacetylase (PgdA/CDA1 family)
VSGSGPLDVTLDAGASTDDLGIDGYAFDFGDGTKTASQPSSTVSHIYDTAGTFTATVTVKDTAGQTSQATATITVTSAPPPPPPPTKNTVVSFTFDDTFSNQAAALDVLTRYGMRGTVYVNSPRIGTTNYFSRTQLTAFQADGHEIGGHTLTHADLATVSSTEAKRQVCDDRSNLLAMGLKAKSFAYPFGSSTSTVKTIVRDCGYNSARGVGDLRSPGYGCNSCVTADTIPPVDVWDIKTNSSVKSDTTLDMLKNYVTQAEGDRGGWVPLVIHSVCNGCASNSININTFTAFVDWLSKDPMSQVKTVDEVIGGPLQPSPGTGTTPPPPPPPGPTASSVTINGNTRAITGTNIYRSADSLILYTPAKGATTGANAYGAEVAVVNGVVVKVENGVGNMAIPSNGYVLSGHGTSRTWLVANATMNAPVTLN